MSRTLLCLLATSGLCAAWISFQAPPPKPTAQRPLASKFVKRTLLAGLTDVTSMTIRPDGAIVLTYKEGALRAYDPGSGRLSDLGRVDCLTEGDKGLLGLAFDPDFAKNGVVYLFYSPRQDRSVNRVSRFVLGQGGLDASSEKILLTIPSELAGHQGGSLDTDRAGNLYISTGDDTQAGGGNGMTPGYAPIDERPAFRQYDAQRTSANTADLRGKILRIKPTATGYDIPDGNLFSPGTDSTRSGETRSGETRSEIFAMGCRNPFRFFVDKPTGTLFWGDVGPDAGGDGERGPRGYDEINRTTEAGFFGWPLFIADNRSYAKLPPVTERPQHRFDPLFPRNLSPHNSGKQALPPARPAFLYYPYLESAEFPVLGTGGRTVMAGFVHHASPAATSPHKLPDYYDGRLFFYDWMRGKVFTTPAFAPEARNEAIEPFLPAWTFQKPHDLEVGPDGRLFLLEYGSFWYNNTDGVLSVIEYHPENQSPLAQGRATVTPAPRPATGYVLTLDGTASTDPDADSLRYFWYVGGKPAGMGKIRTTTVRTPAVYPVSLVVKDPAGRQSVHRFSVNVGNTPPAVTVETPKTGSFRSGGTLPYRVAVSDAEDGSSTTNPALGTRLQTTLHFVAGQVPFRSFQNADEILRYNEGLLAGQDCWACHAVDKPNVGPSFRAIAQRYQTNAEEAVPQLAKRVLEGGSGVWGKALMSAHPQLAPGTARQLVRYILSMAHPDRVAVPNEGSVNPTQRLPSPVGGSYLLRATYQDRPVGRAAANQAEGFHLLRPAVLDPYHHSRAEDILTFGAQVRLLFPTSLIAYDGISLRGVRQVRVQYQTKNNGDNDRLELVWVSGGRSTVLGSGPLRPRSPDLTTQTCPISIQPPDQTGTLEIHLRQSPDVHAHVILKEIELVTEP